MSLQFVTGSSGAGKSYNACQEMIRDSLEHPETQYLVIVPDQFTMQTQKEITGLHPRHGLLNIDVLSFSRLAWRVFEETGGDDRPVLDDVGKSLVLQRVITEKKKELRVLGSSLTRQGSVSQMKSLVSEFLQYRIRPSDLSGLDEMLPGHSWLTSKMRDIQVVYEGFLEYLQSRYLTTEEVPEILCGVIGDSSLVKDSVVLLDGFTGFTPVQYLVVRELLQLCKKVTVTVTMDNREDPARNSDIHQLFHMSKEMIRKLSKLAEETHTEILPLKRIDGSRTGRHAGHEALCFLEKNVFRPQKMVYAGETDQIELLEAENPRAEMTAAAEQILRMVREEGLHYRDFAVLAGDLSVYGREAERIFTAAGIPCFLDRKRPVLANQLVEFLRAAVDMIVQRYSYESVFRFLRSGLTEFRPEEIDRLENYVIALGIRGRKQYEEPWIRQPRSDGQDNMQEYNALRLRFLAMTEELHRGLHERNASARRKAEVLYSFLVRNHLQEKSAARSEKLTAEGRLLMAREYARIWQTICDLLDRLVEVLGDEPMGLEAFQDVLDAGLAECSIGLVPPGEDQVMIGDIERTRLKNIRVLFFAGVNDGVVPKPLSDGGILSDADREWLKQADMELAPSAREEICRQRFYLYLCLTRPSDRLVISWCRTDADGNAMQQSWLTGMIRRMFPDTAVLRDDSEDRFISHLETPEGQRELLISGLQDIRKGETEEGFAELAAWMARTEEGALQLRNLIGAAFADGGSAGLGRELAEQLYGRELENSVTRLEDFASCAFRHFLNYGLRLTEREEYIFTPADFGTVMHAALERFAKNLRKEGRNWTELEDEERDAFADRALDETAHDFHNTILHSSWRSMYMLDRIRMILKRTVWAMQEQLRRGDFRPADFEFAFTDDLETVHFRLPGGTGMKLRGRIDRLDMLEADGRKYLKIIDYKTGKTSLDFDSLWNGTQLQLAVYMNAALESAQKQDPKAEAEPEPAGIFYYHIDDPFLSDDSPAFRDSPDREEKMRLIREEILKKLRPDGLVRSEPEILRHLDRTLEGGASRVIPVSINKDGTLSKNSHSAGGEVFRIIRLFSHAKVTELAERIMEGETAASPLQDGEMTACTWCSFRGICGFDEKLEKCRYRQMERLPDVLERMKEKVLNEHTETDTVDR